MNLLEPNTQKMTEVAKAFPSVQRLIDQGVLDGVEPWDVTAFLKSVEEMPFALGPGVTQALAFVKWLWNPALAPDWDHHRAWSVWGEAHRKVWLEWARHPWWA